MPLPTERLTRRSSDAAIRQAISDAISQLVREGREQDQAIAIAYSSAREHTGKSLGKKQKLKGRSSKHTA